MGLDPKLWWYVTRATGFVSWTLLAVAVLWGLFITNKTLTRSTAPVWVLDLHRHLGGLAVVFVAIHVAALPLDTFTDWGWRDLFVPMASRWHPGAIAWGIVAMYLLIAIEVTSILGRRFPKKWWRRVHMLSFPLYILASIHLFTAGTDSGNIVSQWTVVVTSTLIAFLTAVRALAAVKPRETRASPRAAVARAQAQKTDTGPVPTAAPATAGTAAAPPASPAPTPGDDLLPASPPPPAPDDARSGSPVATLPRIARLTVDERAERIRGHAHAHAHAAKVKSSGT